MRQTILHIGLEKTGTTSIQHLLSQNRQQLRAASVFVPTSINLGNNYHLAIASYAKFRADGLTKQLGISSQTDLDKFRSRKLAALKREFSAAGSDRAIISSEHFQSRLTSKEDVQLLKANLEQAGFDNFKILLYLRDPLKITMSHHGMAIKKGVHVSEDFYSPSHPRVSQILSFERSIQTWQEVFDTVEVRRYPEGQAPEVLLNDFLSAADINPAEIDLTKQERRNVNLSGDALIVLNRINQNSDAVRRLADDRWLFNRLETEFPGSGLSPSAELIDRYEKYFTAEFDRLSKKWFAQESRLFETRWKPQPEYTPEHLADIKVKIEKLIRKSLLRSKIRRFAALPIRVLRRTLAKKSA